MMEDMGGGGLEEEDFAGPGHFVREIAKWRSGDAGGGEKV